MEPTNIAMSRQIDGRWRWDIFYQDESLDVGEIAETLDTALKSVQATLRHLGRSNVVQVEVVKKRS